MNDESIYRLRKGLCRRFSPSTTDAFAVQAPSVYILQGQLEIWWTLRCKVLKTYVSNLNHASVPFWPTSVYNQGLNF